VNIPENSNTASRSEPAGGGAEWEARWQSGDTPWEKGAPAPPLLDWLAGNSIAGPVLVPGCGSGNDVRALATAGAQPLGIDISASAIAHAGSHPHSGSETYRVADLFALPPELTGAFDWVFEHTCFCAIDPSRRGDYVAAVAAALKPTGRMLAIFYLDPGHESGPPFGVDRDEIKGLFNDSFEILEEYVPSISFPGRESRELVCVLSRR
jgi:SAM-dependent methyltransferase